MRICVFTSVFTGERKTDQLLKVIRIYCRYNGTKNLWIFPDFFYWKLYRSNFVDSTSHLFRSVYSPYKVCAHRRPTWSVFFGIRVWRPTDNVFFNSTLSLNSPPSTNICNVCVCVLFIVKSIETRRALSIQRIHLPSSLISQNSYSGFAKFDSILQRIALTHSRNPNVTCGPYYAPPHRIGGIRRWCASDVCLSRTSGLSREQRGPGRLKLAKR